ncbi:MAG: RNA 2',3'-cyclic phosphodiesterase [Flavobacteriales bacterium]|nr:RNA 2',3'-cyclic phosphodiesterase [Flavobacteriales bacterium]
MRSSPSTAERWRLFVGTRIAPEWHDRITTAATDMMRTGIWRRIPTEQWHLTALFIGERPREEVSRITARVARIAERTSPVAVQGGRLALMPESAPTMTWVRFEPGSAHRLLHEALAMAIGVVPENRRPHWPHITIARGHTDPAPAGPILIDTLAVTELTLFRSHLRPNGTIHEALSTWSLR